MQIQAKDFESRQNLESYIKAEFGTDVTANAEHIIVGKREELKVLQLSDMTTVFGVKCQITDETPERFKKKKVK